MPASALSDGVVTLRPWRVSDVSALTAAYASLDIPPSFEPRRSPLTRVDAELFVSDRLAALERGELGSFAIVSRANGRLLGACSVVPAGPTAGRIGYWVAAPSRGRGVLGRALALLVPWATGPAGLRRLHLIARPNNTASRQAAIAAGFLLVGTSVELVRGTPRQVVRYEYEVD